MLPLLSGNVSNPGHILFGAFCSSRRLPKIDENQQFRSVMDLLITLLLTGVAIVRSILVLERSHTVRIIQYKK